MYNKLKISGKYRSRTQPVKLCKSNIWNRHHSMTPELLTNLLYCCKSQLKVGILKRGAALVLISKLEEILGYIRD